ncbi:MAG: hypothetical protein J7M12_03955, partial [Candidatus Hydrogenedentes bacterium]|nr:hypothetical protein [Candidatus Hydrogenedentota bacterium]
GLAVAAAMVTATGVADEANKYVGTKKCKMCHLKQYKSWELTKHSKAFESLSDADKKKADVIKKRTVGYGKPGGFKSLAETPDLVNVGCEDCHGPGGKHLSVKMTDKEAKRASIQDPAKKNVCIECHSMHPKK